MCRQESAIEDAKKVRFGMFSALDSTETILQATELDPTYVKAWSRLATAYQVSEN